MERSKATTANKTSLVITCVAIIAGTIWRWYMVYVAYRPSEHIFSDMKAYFDVARRMLIPGRIMDALDLIQPAGTSVMLAGSLFFTNSLAVADALWFTLSAITPVFWFFTARDLFGMKVGVITGIWTAFHFTSITFASLFMSENPFTFLIAAGWMCFAKAITGIPKRRWQWAAAAGALWGLSVLFRAQGLCLLLMLVVMAVYDWMRTGMPLKSLKLQIRRPVIQAMIGFIVVASGLGLFFSMRSGRPMLTSLNFGCTLLMGHLPDAAEVRFEPAGKGYYHAYGNPAVQQRRPKERYVFPFSIEDAKSSMPAAVELFQNDPLRWIMMSVKGGGESFFGNDPWPSNQMPFANWVRLYESWFLLFGILPGCAMVLHAVACKVLPLRPVAMMALPIFGVWLMSFITQGESRYRVPFDGQFIILASLMFVACWDAMRNRAMSTENEPTI